MRTIRRAALGATLLALVVPLIITVVVLVAVAGALLPLLMRALVLALREFPAGRLDDEVAAFHRECYRAPGSQLVVVGDADFASNSLLEGLVFGRRAGLVHAGNRTRRLLDFQRADAEPAVLEQRVLAERDGILEEAP